MTEQAKILKKEIEILIRKNETLKDEIERLKKNLDDVSKCNINLMYRMDKTKSEARKEFAERLKDFNTKHHSCFSEALNIEIGNLLKEMEGEENERKVN